MTANYVRIRRGTFGLIYLLSETTRDGRTSSRPIFADEYSRLLGAGIPVVREGEARVSGRAV